VPNSACKIFHSTLPVWSAEKVSVEKSARTHNQINVGIHARSLRAEAVLTG